MNGSSLIDATTLGDLLLRSARRWPQREVLVFPDCRLSYAELARNARRRARSLIALGIRPGDHVGMLSPNRPEMVELLFGAALAGAVAVPLNARYRADELAYVIGNADLRVLMTSARVAGQADYPALLREALPGLEQSADAAALQLAGAPLLRSVILLGQERLPGLLAGEDFARRAEAVGEAALDRVRGGVALRDAAIMMYTSGTTARPKGCRLCHEAVVRSAAAMQRRLAIGEQDRMWNPLPLFHMAAILPLLATVVAGGCFISDTFFDADRAIGQLHLEQPSILYPAFPAIMADLVNHPDFDASRLACVRLVSNVAPPERLRANMRLLPGAVHVSAYGMTEASGISCHGSPAEDDETRASSCGEPYEGVRMRVVDADSGEELPAGERGEIRIGGFSLFEGYYRSSQATAEAFDAEGWFRTGDLGSIAATGQVSYHGRLKDLLKIGGENVSPLELESFIGSHPAVQLVQVVGAPDPRLQEVAAAFVQLKPGMALTEQDLVAFCRGRIASFKVPRHVRFVTQWPMSATKIQKHALREALAQELAALPEPGS